MGWRGVSQNTGLLVLSNLPSMWQDSSCLFQCSVTCGSGLMKRSVECTRPYSGGQQVISLSQCTTSPHPATTTNCSLEECPQHVQWFLSAWGQVSSYTRAHFLSLARSKLRLCSANHRAGYFSNLTCDWLSIAWAYSKQETENEPRSLTLCATSGLFQ